MKTNYLLNKKGTNAYYFTSDIWWDAWDEAETKEKATIRYNKLLKKRK